MIRSVSSQSSPTGKCSPSRLSLWPLYSTAKQSTSSMDLEWTLRRPHSSAAILTKHQHLEIQDFLTLLSAGIDNSVGIFRVEQTRKWGWGTAAPLLWLTVIPAVPKVECISTFTLNSSMPAFAYPRTVDTEAMRAGGRNGFYFRSSFTCQSDQSPLDIASCR